MGSKPSVHKMRIDKKLETALERIEFVGEQVMGLDIKLAEVDVNSSGRDDGITAELVKLTERVARLEMPWWRKLLPGLSIPENNSH